MMIKIEESQDAQDCLEFQRSRRSIEIQNKIFFSWSQSLLKLNDWKEVQSLRLRKWMTNLIYHDHLFENCALIARFKTLMAVQVVYGWAKKPCHWMRRGRCNHAMVLEAARSYKEPKNIFFFLIDEHTIIWRICIVERQSQSKIKQIWYLQVTAEKAFNPRFTRHWWPSKWYMAEQNPCHWWRPPFCG